MADSELRRELRARDGALLTVGAMVGTGIFLAAGDVARALPNPSLILGAWMAGGALTLTGALTYAELGAMFPRAGGLYHFVREAWGPLPAFLYGWTCLLVIMTGGIAAIGVGFGEYLGALLPAFSSSKVVLSVGDWRATGAQFAGALAIVALTLVNQAGVRHGARVQNLFTAAKVAAIALLAAVAFTHPGVTQQAARFVMPAGLGPAIGMALVAVLWTFDGWYALTFAAAEMRDPARDLPRAILGGVAAVTALYVLLNLVYLRTLSLDVFGSAARPAETAARVLMGDAGATLVTVAVALSAFGCLAATVLYASRVYAPMADDGVFPRVFGRIHAKSRTPAAALWLQCAWAVALTLTSGYTSLFIYVTFGSLLFHLLGALALFRLRATRPRAARPYRVAGYPLLPALFVGATLWLAGATLAGTPRESLLGLLVIASGVPAYLGWRRGRRAAGPDEDPDVSPSEGRLAERFPGGQ
ncbi:MAG: APC family permease [Candidatus Eisenbacteria bacterium]|nr:APC family permease [Candidatus Eisenbacteria bacterium]